LDTLVAKADYVTLHVPENEETRKMINEARLRKMKNGATLVNCARAGIIDEAALRKVKAEKGLRFLNDVYPKDEAGPKSVADIADLMVPHLGASTKEANAKAAQRAAEQLIEYDEKRHHGLRREPRHSRRAGRGLLRTRQHAGRVCLGVLGRDAKLRTIETSFYGSLKPYGDWLIVPIVAALWEEFQRSMDPKAAAPFLQGGASSTQPAHRRPQGYANSITLDMTGTLDAATLRQVSVRGTVAEKHADDFPHQRL